MLAPITDRLSRHGYLLAVAAVCLSTLLFLPGRDVFAKGQWAILYLLVVVLVAGTGGIGPAVLAAALSFFCWNFFFLPPLHTLRIRAGQDWLSLLAFLAVAIAMGVQTGRLREREARAVAREREAAAVGKLSAYLVSEVSTSTVSDTLLREAVRLLGAERALLFLPDAGGRLQAAGAAPDDAPHPPAAVFAAAEWVLAHDEALGVPPLADDHDDPDGPLAGAQPAAPDGELDRESVYVPLHTAEGVHGVLSVLLARGARSAPAVSRRNLLASLANLMAAFLERQLLLAEVTRADAEREADLLKSSLLSSVSHELKTPLAALTATVSNLLESDMAWDEATARAELEAIVADVVRLNNGVTSLLDLSRLESGAWAPLRDWYDLDDLIHTALDALPAASRQRVRLFVPEDLQPLHVDFEQWVRVLRNLIENALVYSPPGSEVKVAAAALEDRLEIWVEDSGPGVPPEERERVFAKFFRGSQVSGRVPSGTGLGLAIAREIVAMHGGSISVGVAAAGGARFEIVLPTGAHPSGDSGEPRR
ncbi:MAG: DUF4118 domain-containing protein, partial [Thermoleophilia bacterium]